MLQHTAIEGEVFARFLRCALEADLHSRGIVGADREFGSWQRQCRDKYKQAASVALRSLHRDGQVHVGTPAPSAIKAKRWGLIIDCIAESPEARVRLDAVELAQTTDRTGSSSYYPIRFVPSERVANSDKLLLAFDALALSRIAGVVPSVGRIIYGSRFATTVVPLAKLIPEVRAAIAKIAALRSRTEPPAPVLNKHCAECEFQSRCRSELVKKDDLSLLTTLNQGERKAWNDKGIFTVTQLSYAFRAPRRTACKAARPLKHNAALKALAVRKAQIHVLGTPHWNEIDHPVYFDVEGVPEREFYYLLGLRHKVGDRYVQHSFWADDSKDEREMWASCLHTLAEIHDPRLVHYGRYETLFLKRMRARYPDITACSDLADHLASSALNLLSFAYAQIYFPTYSNTLKEIGRFLGFQRSTGDVSGLNALMWRSEWERSRDQGVKQQLITYNAEDCEAVQRVAEAIACVCSQQQTDSDEPLPSVKVDELAGEHPRRFGPVNFAVPVFEQINAASYWDYQRTKVYVRTSDRLRRASHTRRRGTGSDVRANKEVQAEAARPARCSRCGGTILHKNGRFTHTIYDLRFSLTGIRRWIVRYRFNRYTCWKCKAGFNELPPQSKYGRELKAYVAYQLIELRVSQHALARHLQTIFGLAMSVKTINNMKSVLAETYTATYSAILQRIAEGGLVHADETKVKIEGADGYVWVFTNMEDVAYVYSETREAAAVQEVLRDFHGVLVSDFYAAYDGLPCKQQKCLIHLIRDLNEDVHKHPFNDEMRDIAQAFGALLRPVVETIDRFGLRSYHLRKHKKAVARFYKDLIERNCETEVAIGCTKRLAKYFDRLFTFLDWDGVPWNNNNAEHAIKTFARLRNTFGGRSTPKGLREYLVLLSVSETCKYKGHSFLSFLRSGELDIDNFTKL
jgi:predicted RecB family nuclease